MNTFKIIPALALLTLSLNAKPNGSNTNEKTLQNKMECPVELMTEKSQASVRISFKVNQNDKAENVIINAEDNKIKQYVVDKLAKLEFPQKNEEVSLVIHFKIA